MRTRGKKNRLTNPLLDRSLARYRHAFRRARALRFWRVGGVSLAATGMLGLAVGLATPRAVAEPLTGSLMLADLGNTVAGATISGVADSDSTGLSVSGTGDVNGDGIDDFLIGSYGADAGGTNRGETYLVYGRGGTNPLSGSLDLAALGSTVAGATFKGIANDDQAGRSVSGAGDVNGDGLADVLIGAWHGNGAGDNRGETYLVYGKGGGSPLSGAVNLADVGGTVAGATFNGAADSDQSGYSVSGAGDVNGDGLADLLIAGFGMSQGYLVYGQPDNGALPLTGSLELHNVGAEVAGVIFHGITGELAVSGAGDVNGDGIDDILIGSGRVNSNRGQNYLVYGQPDSSPLWSSINLADVGDTVAGATFDGKMDNGFAGLSVSGAGDVNGDGLDDLLIGAMYANGHGETYLIYGQPESSPLSGSLDLAHVGGTLEGATFTGALSGDHAGSGVSGAGDVNGDGQDDIVIGAWHAPGGWPNRGESYLVYGQPDSSPLSGSLDLAHVGSTLTGAAFEGVEDLGRSGRAVSGAGDVNDDGVADFLIGAFTANGTGTSRGENYLVYGQGINGTPTFTWDGGAGDWGASTWNGGSGPPGASDDAVIDLAGSLVTVSDTRSANSTDVSDGRLDVNGTLNSPVTTSGSGVVGGTGTIGADLVLTGGTLAPGTNAGTGNLAGGQGLDVPEPSSIMLFGWGGSLVLSLFRKWARP